MTQKFTLSWVQIMALLALFGILSGVVGTAWLSLMPVESPTDMSPVISSEVNS